MSTKPLSESKQFLKQALAKRNPLAELGFSWAQPKRPVAKPSNSESNTLFRAIKSKFGIDEPWAVKNILTPFARQETRTRNINQADGGHGRGFYQFDDDSLTTAINRYGALIGNPTNSLAKWHKQNPNATASDLTPRQQGHLTLANLAQHPKTDLLKARQSGNTYPLWLVGHHGPYDPNKITQKTRDQARWIKDNK